MKECTPMEARNRPGLPQEELLRLKKTVYDCFPYFNRNPVDFEPVWEKSLNALQQCCNKPRHFY